MNKFNYDKYCIKLLLNNISEIKNLDEPLKSTFEWYAKDNKTFLAYSLYEDILCPYFIMLTTKKDDNSKQIIIRIAILIESLITHKNFQVRCVAEVGFLEKLVYDMNPRKDL